MAREFLGREAGWCLIVPPPFAFVRSRESLLLKMVPGPRCMPNLRSRCPLWQPSGHHWHTTLELRIFRWRSSLIHSFQRAKAKALIPMYYLQRDQKQIMLVWPGHSLSEALLAFLILSFHRRSCYQPWVPSPSRFCQIPSFHRPVVQILPLPHEHLLQVPFVAAASLQEHHKQVDRSRQ